MSVAVPVKSSPAKRDPHRSSDRVAPAPVLRRETPAPHRVGQVGEATLELFEDQPEKAERLED